ncbi:SCO family protein [Aquabacterium sp.]|uniref:SCO family protein n=1 Tax=Aquabacterium sp. TaxID=1872578 RepID=UPI0025C34939|nr:SCO family protein [Aquabacterium sp.]
MRPERRALIGLLLSTAAVGLRAQITPREPALQHGEAPLPGLGGPLDLIDQHGKPFRLQQLKGEAVIVFFGFTRCSQSCPIALAQWQAVVANMGMRRPPRVVFVTLDPLSDDPAALKAYVAGFGPQAIGLTGTPTQIDEAARRYGIGVEQGGKELAHSARWFLLGPELRPMRAYKVSTPPALLAQDLTKAQQFFDANTAWQKGRT